MQPQAPAPQPPPPPPPSPSPRASVAIDAGPEHAAQTIAIPQSPSEMEGLRTRLRELESQRDLARTRRRGIIGDLGTSSRREREGLEQRLIELDERILQIETDIGATERALANAPPAVIGAVQEAEAAAELARMRAEGPIHGDVIGVLGFIGFLMLIPLALAYARQLFRRPGRSRALSLAAESRLERIEQAVEAVAEEVQRVSDGQRFVTRLMSEAKIVPGRAEVNTVPNS